MSFEDEFWSATGTKKKKKGVASNGGSPSSITSSKEDDFNRLFWSEMEEFQKEIEENKIKRDAEEEKEETRRKLQSMMGYDPEEEEEDEKTRKALEALTKNDKLSFKKGNDDDRTWFQKGATEEGVSFDSVMKGITSTADDVRSDLMQGILGIGEKTVDAGATLIGGIGKLFGADEFSEDVQGFIKKDIIDEEKIAFNLLNVSTPLATKRYGTVENLEESSFLGDKSDSLVQSAGQLLATRGMQKYIPWWVTSGTTSFGGEAENAFNQGAGYGEAVVSSAFSAGFEIATEKLFGGSGLGEKGLINTQALTKGVSNKAAKILLDLGIDIVGEGFEEVAAEFGSILGRQLTYEREETLEELFTNEEAMDKYMRQVADSLFGAEAREAYGEAAIGGMVLGGGANVVKAGSSIHNKTDYHTGLNANEEAVVNREVEKRIEQAEKDGKKLSKSDKSKIQEEVVSDLDKGYISTDTIEEVLGGDTYKSYQDTVKSEDSLVEQEKTMRDEFNTLNRMKKSDMTGEQSDRLEELRTQLSDLTTKIEDTKKTSERDFLQRKYKSEAAEIAKGSRLEETYRERARGGQKFEADVSKYKGVAKKSIESIIEKGQMNNSNKAHDLIDWAVKLGAARGKTVTTTTTEEILSKAEKAHGKQYVLDNFYKEVTDENGKKKLVLKAIPNAELDGDTIALNVDSKNLSASVFGHELGHTLEGTKYYNELADLLNSYDKTVKGNEAYEAQKAATEGRYQNIAGANAQYELNADLLGEYVFSDEGFVKHLTQNRNVFQKIYDQIKYMVKYATAGSQQQKDLLRIQHTFEKAWREAEKAKKTTPKMNGNTVKSDTSAETDVQYSLREEAPPKKTQKVYKLMRLTDDGKIAPLFIDSSDTLEIGKWYNADSPNMDFLKELPSGIFLVDADTGTYQTFDEYLEESGEKKTKYPSKNAINKATAEGKRWVYIEDTKSGQRRFGGEARKYWNLGINGSGAVSTFSMRPGYHAGSLPTMRQIGKGQNRDLRDDTFVWTEGEVPADIDYQAEAEQNPDKDIPTHIPTDGYYLKATNADKAKSQADRVGWYVAGAYKINRIMSDSEARRVIDDWNKAHPDQPVEYDYDRESGMDFDAEQMKLVPRADAKYSVSEIDEATAQADAQKAVERFGTTSKFEQTGYVLADGRMLNMTRDYNVYHDQISEIFSDVSGREAVNRFVQEGNVRLVPVSSGIEIGETPLSTNQLNVVSRFVGNSLRSKGYFFIDITGKDGKNIASFEYDSDSSASDVIYDIKQYYERGRIPSKKVWYSLSEDTSGRKLTAEQKEFFKDSKVVDEDGNLKVMYHGTSNGGHTVFDTYGSHYGLFGTGSYFTDSKDIAEGYTKKGKGNNPQVYESYLNITNPIDMDAQADAEAWQNAFPDASFPESGTNEQFYRAMEEYFEDNEYSRGEASEMAMEALEGMGYDGITHIGGGRVNANGANHQVYIAFHPEQIKDIGNAKPTGDPDVRYSLTETDNTYLDAVKRGDMETAQRLVDEVARNSMPNSKVRDENGELHLVYHGSPVKFTVFDHSKMNAHGNAHGRGFYFTEDRGLAEGYEKDGGQLLKGYLNIEKPLSEEKATIKKADLVKLIKATSESEAQVLVNEGGYDNVREAVRDTWVSNYVDTYGTNINAVYREVADIIYSGNENDVDIIAEITNSGAGNEIVLKKTYEVLGYDGVIYTNEMTGKHEYVALVSNQFKSTDPVTYDDNGNVIPLSERFNQEKNDIRFSLSDADAEFAPTGYNVPLRDLRLETLPENTYDPSVEAPMQEDVAPVETEQDMFPDDYAPMSEDESAAEERLASLDESVMPPENEPYYGEDEVSAPADPFEDRDIKEVGNRKVKAYMYENPEVKPFFQEEANIMLGELNDTVKGERIYSEEGGWTGTSRYTSDDIAYLRDSLGYTYAEIEKGLNAIIEDDGAENNAISKRIEFILNDRLADGYTDFRTGMGIPANQEYINLLNEKQITDYSREAWDNFVATADQYAPPAEEDMGPVVESAPIKEEYEAIRPPKRGQRRGVEAPDEIGPVAEGVEYGDKLVRVDSPYGTERSWYGTSTRSKAVDGAFTPDDIPNELRYYEVKSNRRTLDRVNARLESLGYEKAVEAFEANFSAHKVTLDDMVLGQRLIQEAVKRGDLQTAIGLDIDVSVLGTELGQMVQSMSIIQRLSPEGQLRALRRIVDRGQARGDRAFDGVEVTDDIAKEITDVYKEDGTFDQDELNAAVERAKQKTADQMKVTKWDKANAWRYFAMLGNAKTHDRNVVSNIANFATRIVKNALARTGEDVFLRKSDSRTKTWKMPSKEVREYAKQFTKEHKDSITGPSKYSESSDLKSKRRIFKNKALHTITEANSKLLEAEDALFSRPTFRMALAEYLTANGIKTREDIKNNPKTVLAAEKYAKSEAKKSTFQQDSFLASKIKEIEQRGRLWEIGVGSVMPFKKTPINIAKTGIAYSPIGFLRGVYDLTQIKSGKVDATTAIDHLAEGITGTSLAVIGYALASMGALNGAGDDDKEGKFDYQLGKSSYSIKIGDEWHSLNWLSPVAMPLFVGANAYEVLVEKEEWDFDMVSDALGKTLDPMSEMSFLSSLDSVLSSYGSGTDKFFGAAESMAQSYATQYIPTLFSQTAQMFDDKKRSTKPSKDSKYTFGEETWNKIRYKVPFLRNTLEPSTDIWGNEIELTDNVLAKSLETFLAPWNTKDNIETEIDTEIKSLYSQTGATEVVPTTPYNYFDYKGEKYEMSASEHTAFKNTYGQTAYNLLEELFDTDTYQDASAEEKADMVSKVYDYARDEARRKLLAGRGVSFTNATKDNVEYYRENPIKGAIENDMSPDEYTFYQENTDKYNFLRENNVSYRQWKSFDEDTKEAYNWAFKNPEKRVVAKAVADDFVQYRKYASDLYDIKADKDSDGKTISGSRKDKVLDYINGLDADYGEKIILFKSEYPSDDTYNYEIIDYLNSRDDISYDEMNTILKELGFTVNGNNITWD